jgi:hypothetical protein
MMHKMLKFITSRRLFFLANAIIGVGWLRLKAKKFTHNCDLLTQLIQIRLRFRLTSYNGKNTSLLPEFQIDLRIEKYVSVAIISFNLLSVAITSCYLFCLNILN